MIRILMIGISQNMGGVETYILNVINEFNQDVHFFFPKKDGVLAHEQELKEKYTIINTPVSRREYLLYSTMWRKIFSYYKFDVVYYNKCDLVSIDILRFAKAAGVPIRIIHSHSTGNQQGIEKKMSLFHRVSESHNRKVLDKYVTHLLACSKVAGEWMFDGRQFTVIKNGISLPKFSYNKQVRNRIRDELQIGEGKLIGVIGRISPEKNPFFTIKVLQRVIDNNEYSAVFVGDGELRLETEASVKEAGLDNRIHFVGAVDNVNEWLSAVDCLLMPSLFEGLPFVLVEAQAAGLACVVSSAISEEANISGELRYIGLDEPLDVWENSIVQAANSYRYDAAEKLIEAGYSISDSAKIVEKLIKTALNKEEYNQK